MIIQIIKCLLAGMDVGFQAVLSVLPFYQELSSIKEQLLSAITGIPVFFISFVLMIPTIVKIVKKVLL